MGYEPWSKRWRFRMWIANLINRLDKDVCWSRICGWATGLDEEISIWPWSDEYPSHQGCTQESGAYCGKCYQNGRLKDDREEKELRRLLTDTWLLIDRATLIFGKDCNQEYYDAWDRYRELEMQCEPYLNSIFEKDNP